MDVTQDHLIWCDLKAMNYPVMADDMDTALVAAAAGVAAGMDDMQQGDNVAECTLKCADLLMVFLGTHCLQVGLEEQHDMKD